MVLEWQKAINIRKKISITCSVLFSVENKLICFYEIACIGNDDPDKSNIKQLSPLEFLQEYGFAVDNYTDDIWIMLLLTIIFYLVAYKITDIRSKGQACY